jgi:uncharacterized membrane protein YebE (DUF533 family)
MLDAKNLLDALMRGANTAEQQEGLGSLEDLLRQLAPNPQRGGVPGVANDRGDMLPGPMGVDTDSSPVGERGSGSGGKAFSGNDGKSGVPQRDAGDLGDMLRNALGDQGAGFNDILGKLQQRGGGLAEILGQVLGQATSGVREGAGHLDDATGASRYARDALGQATDRSPEELIAQIKELIANNRLGTGVALGGLGALLLGTGAGRAVAASAIKLGGLALIGGLAFKAYQNYRQGQPVLTGARRPQSLLAAPEGSGFEPGAASHEHATLLIRAMIAAAAADGRIDPMEQNRILGGLKQARMEVAAQRFLAEEIAHPATVDELADAVTSPQQAVQVYTAARIVVDPDLAEEHEFLAALADRLQIDETLAAHIDSAARDSAS